MLPAVSSRPYGLLIPTKEPSFSRASAQRKAPTSGLSKKKPTEAVLPLLDLARNLTASSPADLRQQALLAAAECRRLLPDVEDGKRQTLAETYRVLKPGGRCYFADVLLEDRVTAEEVARRGSWSE